ncbi:virB8 family protein [Paracoccus zhejiangensis]|uniref:Type IV secretion system protein VirB8 n=1 Tax=Paracoccus zhejiangensis TaxID=1077935 RepID=A0A2H5F5X5_9RHOB|nr:type IV secretion system protein [Paracoccus zhejiangensis]AUH66950.1 type IV secretion system protein VirB8 [Paracoccus zhejiangensis]
MTDRLSEQKTILESELIFGARRSLRTAWGVAGLTSLIALGALSALILLLPLKETQAYLTIVDRDTGIAERAVAIEKATIEQADAVKQSLVFNYVMDRETYDANDNERRILKVYRQSAGLAQQGLRALWTEGNADYPPDLYGTTGKISIEVLSVNPIDEDTVQLRFTKTLTRPGEDDRIGNFYATVTWQFVPTQQSAVELVWENPFGFTVTDYRVSAESLEAQQDGGK